MNSLSRIAKCFSRPQRAFYSVFPKLNPALVDPFPLTARLKPILTEKDALEMEKNAGKPTDRQPLEKTMEALNLMQESYPRIYAQIKMRGHRFHVVRGDLIETSHLKGVQVGEIIKFNNVCEIGTKQCTLRSTSAIDPSYYHITGIVIEQGRARKVLARIGQVRRYHVKKLAHKARITLIRIRDIRLVTPKYPAPLEPIATPLEISIDDPK